MRTDKLDAVKAGDLIAFDRGYGHNEIVGAIPCVKVLKASIHCKFENRAYVHKVSKRTGNIVGTSVLGAANYWKATKADLDELERKRKVLRFSRWLAATRKLTMEEIDKLIATAKEIDDARG